MRARERVLLARRRHSSNAIRGVHVIEDRTFRRPVYAILFAISVRPWRVRMRLIAAAALLLVFVAAVARAATPAECGAPVAMSDDWPVSPPAQQGLEPELIC